MTTVREICQSGKAGRICDRCAKAACGEAPDEHHISTYNFMACDVCGEKTSVASTFDWVWPWQRRRFT